ncbi:MAG: ABC-three component system protein [Candidatus Paceibacterota bacterium]
MNIDYYNLSDTQFEDLVIEFCVELLGGGVQGFVTGKDGGRDARFEGTANCIPSTANPWSGKVVIQAKHTEIPTRSFSESDFSGTTKSSVLSKELLRVRSLLQNGELEFYMLFANRRLTGITEAGIRKRIASETGLAEGSVRMYDVSELGRLEKRYPQCTERANLNPARAPADIDPTDLANVITKLADYKQQLDELMESEVPPPSRRITPEEKNQKTGLQKTYFSKQIRPAMVDFPPIRSFLAHPDNRPFQKLYDETVDELEAKLDAWNEPDVTYERVLEVLVSRLFSRDFDLRQHRKLTRTVIYYMYCNCDIGKDAE